MDHHRNRQSHLPPQPPPINPHLFNPNFHHNNNYNNYNNYNNNNPYMQNHFNQFHPQNPPFYFPNNYFPPQNPTNNFPQFPILPPKPALSLDHNHHNSTNIVVDTLSLPQEQQKSPPSEVEVTGGVDSGGGIQSSAEIDEVVEKIHSDMVSPRNEVEVKGGVDNGDRIQSLAEIDKVVENIHSDMVAANEDIYVWKVSSLALLQLKAKSWVSLGFQLREIPSFNRLILQEAKNVDGSVGTFITTWKEACLIDTRVELFDKILDFYLKKRGRRTELISCFSTSPFLGLLNIAVISIQKGTWDSFSNTFQLHSEPIEDVDDSIKTFVRNWKEDCQEFTAAEVFEKLLVFCVSESKKRNKLRHIFSTYPMMGFLDVAVTSIKSGVWDSLCDTLKSRGEIGLVIKQADKLKGSKSLDVEPIEKDFGVPSEGHSCHTDVSCPLEGPPADFSEKVVLHQKAEPDLNEHEAVHVIVSIRREEFGLDPNVPCMESSMLQKQHARFGRALHFLSQELHSKDSHFLLELVQNADDNLYSENVEPTLTFILQPTCISILNNERGFNAENMRALSDVGNSTKKGSFAGQIGQKGIGFKSVFRVTDAPEIHSGGFHVKFDTSECQLGYVLPTIIPPCDFEIFQTPAIGADIRKDMNTYIRLPFKQKLLEGSSINNISSMFSDLHPSLLLFLRRLRCINLMNMLDDSLIIMKKEIVGDGIVRVSRGKEKLTWFVTSTNLHPKLSSSNAHMTEVSIAFMLKELENGVYEPFLQQQPVFAFLPLRRYGLKFILQADFVLPSSREEVDGDSPWNQWLLSEFPDLFINAERSICSLPCFLENPAKAVNLYMSFVPHIGEVLGFFSELPGMIISKLRQKNCLLQDGYKDKWVTPCEVLKGSNEQAQILLPHNLLYDHLGLVYLHKDIDLPDTLSTALGVQIYGSETLIQFILSLGQIKDGIKSMGLGWLFSWLNELHSMILANSSSSKLSRLEHDILSSLKKVPFIPLSNGTYSSLDEGTIWVHDYVRTTGDGEFGSDAFPCLYATLRTVSPTLFSESIRLDLKLNCMRMLENIGVRLISAHDLIKVHILPLITNHKFADKDHRLMVEYITYVMLHLQSNCIDCHDDKDHIISDLSSKAVILTNHGLKQLDEVPIHFSREFGNSVHASKFLHGLDYKWHEIDTIYLKTQINESVSCGLTQWRHFFKKLGVTDFVKIVPSEKSISVLSPIVLKHMLCNKYPVSQGLIVGDWESPELVDILHRLSKDGSQEKCKYFLEVLDALWDDHFSDKGIGFYSSIADRNKKIYFKSSLVACLSDVKWVVSSVDSDLHLPRELFYGCDDVLSILGRHAPYAVPKIGNGKLLSEIGFKTQVTLDDALSILRSWGSLKTPFTASLSQMCKFYTFIWKEMAMSRQQVIDAFTSGPVIFVPSFSIISQEEDVAGVFLTLEDVYWHDSSGAVDHIKDVNILALKNSILSRRVKKKKSVSSSSIHSSKILCSLYPNLHNFFVSECGVKEAPSFLQYLQILKHLSKIPLSEEVGKMVFRILLWWSSGLDCDTLCPKEIAELKSCISQCSVLPAMQGKWVSTVSSFGMIVTREAISSGPIDCDVTTSVVKWVLPFALRYLYNLHPDSYNRHKLGGFSKIRNLQIVVTEKLFYRNVIKKYYCASKKQYECSSLLQLQDNILYTTKDSDPHSIFMEISRLLFDGIPNLHLANFLHLMTLMVRSGSTEEYIELFILNSQNLAKLPNDESILFLPSQLSSTSINGQISGKSKESTLLSLPTIVKKSTSLSLPAVVEESIISSPSDVKENSTLLSSAVVGKLKLSSSPAVVEKLLSPSSSAVVWKLKTCTKSQVAITNQNGNLGATDNVSDGLVQEEANATSVNDQISSKSKEKSTFSSLPIVVWKPKTGIKLQAAITSQNDNLSITDDVSDNVIVLDQKADALPNLNDALESCLSLKLLRSIDQDGTENGTKSIEAFDDPSGMALESPLCLEVDPLETGRKTRTFESIPAPQTAMLTGRQGEEAAFKYFKNQSNGKIVTWVFQENETGLPYDILVGDEENKEYIEVKASRNSRKNWFQITRQEWEFATEKGDSFSVAYVILSDQNHGKLTVYKNPVKLCQTGVLRLVTMSPKCYYIRTDVVNPLSVNIPHLSIFPR